MSDNNILVRIIESILEFISCVLIIIFYIGVLIVNNPISWIIIMLLLIKVING
jgi:hypothetical protein